jgi:hypothetical protein
MGKITCRCGNVISNNRDSNPYGADFIPNKSLDQWDAKQQKQLSALIEAIRGGKSVAEFLEVADSYAEVVEALLVWKIGGEPFYDLSRELLQCDMCGRLLVETNRRNEFRTFLPESDDSHHILDD